MVDPYRPGPPAPAAPLPLDGRPPRLLAHLHLFGPSHNAGAEVYVMRLLHDLQRRGWEVRVTVRGATRDYEHEGLDVRAGHQDRTLGVHYGWCDVALTHLDVTRQAMAWARRAGRPLVVATHNHRQLSFHRVRRQDAALALWNSEWVQGEHDWWDGHGLLVRPPVPDLANVGRRSAADAVTLVNLNEDKGGHLFARLAARCPERPFLGVRGAYGEQILPHTPNAVVQANSADMEGVWARTRVLAVPSSYESWGMAAVEALAHGIPVVAHPTPGLRESMGAGAIFVDRDDEDGWVRTLDMLDAEPTYRLWSDRARRRAVELAGLVAADRDVLAVRLAELAEKAQRRAA